MTAEQWAALIALVSAGAGGVGWFFKTIVAAVRDLILAQKETTAAIGDLRTELATLRSRVDTLIDVRRATDDDGPPAPLAFPLRQKTPKPRG